MPAADPYVDDGPESSIPGGNEEPRKRKKRPQTPAPGPQPREPQQAPGPGGGSQPTDPQAPPYHPPPEPTYNPPPEPQLPNYEQQIERSFKTHLLNQRVSMFGSSVARDAPFMVAGMVFSGASMTQVRRIARGLDSSWAWLTQPLTPAMLSRLLFMHVLPYDELARSQLPLGDFHATAAMENTLGIGQSGRDANLALQAMQLKQIADEMVKQVTDIHKAVVAEEVTQRAKAIQNEAYRLEAEAIRRMGANPPWLDFLGDVTGLDWINQTLLQKPVRTLLGYGEDVVDRAGSFDPAKVGFGPGSGAELLPTEHGELKFKTHDPFWDSIAGTMGAVNTVLGGGLAAGASVSGQALEHIPGVGPKLHSVAEDLLGYPSKAFRWVAEEAQHAGNVVADLTGAKPGTPQYEATASTAAFLIQWYGFKFIATTSGVFREARSQPAPAGTISKAELKAAAKEAGFTGVKTPEAAFRARWSNDILGFHGPVALTQGLYADLIRRLVSLPAEKWFTQRGSPGRSFSEWVARINRKVPVAERAGALMESHKGMDPALANKLSDLGGDWQHISSYMIERSKKPSEEQIALKRQEKADLEAMLRRNTAEDGTALTDFDRADVNVQIRDREHWLNELTPDEPIFRVPNRSRWRQLQTGAGTSRVSRWANMLWDPHPGWLKLPKGWQKVTDYEGKTTREMQYTASIMPGPISLSRMFDDAPKSTTLWIKGGDAPVDALSLNAELLGHRLRRLGVSNTRIRTILGRMAKAADEGSQTAQFHVLVNDVGKAIEDSPFIAPDMKYAAVERFKSDLAQREKSKRYIETTDAQGNVHLVPQEMLTRRITEGVHVDHTVPIATETKFLTHAVPFLDFEFAIEATSWSRSMIRGLRNAATEPGTARSLRRYRARLKKAVTPKERAAIQEQINRATKATKGRKQAYTPKGIIARIPLVPLDVVTGILDAATAIGKPAVLVTRTLGALPLRIQLEQGLRNFMWGYDGLVYRGVIKRSRAAEEALNPQGPYGKKVLEAMGSIVRDTMEPANTRKNYGSINFENHRLTLPDGSPHPNRAILTEDEAAALVEEMGSTHTGSPEIKQLLEYNGDIDEFVRWAEGESNGARRYRANFAKEWDRTNELHGMTWGEQVRQVAEWKMEEIRLLTNNNEALIQAMTTGRGVLGGLDLEDAARAGMGKLSKGEEYQKLLDERDFLERQLDEPDLPKQSRRGFMDARKKVLDEMDTLERKGVGPGYTNFVLNFDHPDAFATTLVHMNQSGEYIPPPRVTKVIDEALPAEIAGSRGRIRNAEKWSRVTERMLYTGLRAAAVADIRGTRGSLFYQIWRDRFAELAARYGTKDVEWLKSQSMWRAARETANLHYDLAARSSMHRFFRNFFWFLPAYQEVLTTWAIKIPSRYGQVLGQLYLVNQVSAVIDLLKDTGVITKGPPTKDHPEGEDRIAFGAPEWLAPLIGGETELGPNGNIISFRPSGLNLVAGGLPSLAPVPAIAIGKMARKYGGIYKDISDAITFNGADTALFPQGINYMYEAMFGRPNPLEVFSQDLLKNIHDSAFDDSLAMAYYTLGQQGIHSPNPKDFATDKDYYAAKMTYYRRWMGEAEHILKGRYWVKAFGATISPVSLSISTEYREDFTRTWFKITGGKPLTDGLNNAQRAELENWIGSHPSSLAYRVFRNQHGDPVRELPWDAVELNDRYYTEELQAIEPEEFQRRVMVFESNRHFSLQRNGIYKGMTGAQMAASYRAVHNELAPINEAQDTWRRLNKVEYAEFEQYVGQYNDPKTIPEFVRSERLKETAAGLNLLAEMFTPGGVRTPEFRSTLTQLNIMWSDSNTDEYPEPDTPAEKGFAWYMGEYIPYAEKMGSLYEKANAADNRGDSDGATAIYAQIRKLANNDHEASHIGPDGEDYRSFEEFSFGNLEPEEQNRRVLHWVTEPLGWLTNWQREQIGFDGDVVYGSMFDRMEEYRADYTKKYLDPLSESSNDYAYYKDYLENTALPYIAEQRGGSEGLRLYKLSMGAPYQRINALGYGKGVPGWSDIVTSAKEVTRQLKEADLSPKGDTSELQERLKGNLFAGIDALRTQRGPNGEFTPDAKALDRFFTDLGYATATSGDDYKEGPPLYNALFFNNWFNRIVPDNPSVYDTIGPGAEQTAQTTAANQPFKDFAPATYAQKYKNGQVPLSEMVSVGESDRPYAVNGQLFMRPDAAASFRTMQEAAARDGVHFVLANAYRTADMQAEIHQRIPEGSTTAGRSDHGLGLAFDLDGNAADYEKARAWIIAHAHEYGWINAAVEDKVWNRGGWNGNDAGHFSFYAGGVVGGGDGAQYGIPRQDLDRRWVKLARQYTPI